MEWPLIDRLIYLKTFIHQWSVSVLSCGHAFINKECHWKSPLFIFLLRVNKNVWNNRCAEKSMLMLINAGWSPRGRCLIWEYTLAVLQNIRRVKQKVDQSCKWGIIVSRRGKKEFWYAIARFEKKLSGVILLYGGRRFLCWRAAFHKLAHAFLTTKFNFFLLPL